MGFSDYTTIQNLLLAGKTNRPEKGCAFDIFSTPSPLEGEA